MKLASIFTDHMVLQADMPIRIFGEGFGTVSVSFLGNSAKAVSKGGKWCVELPKASYGGPFEMEILLNDEKIVLKDIYVGEVWIAGGQSNMELPLYLTEDPYHYAKHAYNDKIRFFTVPRRHKADSYLEPDTPWDICTEDTAISFSAIGYFVAQELNEKLGVAIGIISCNWGGTRIEPFTSREYFKDSPAFTPYLEEYNKKFPESEKENFIAAFDEYQKELSQYRKKYPSVNYRELVKRRGVFATASYVPTPEVPVPDTPDTPFARTVSGALFDSMFMRIIPFGIKGFLWYQGESNGADKNYLEKYGVFMKCMRDNFKNPNMPFYAVELASFSCAWSDFAQIREDRFVNDEDGNWAFLREQQQEATEVFDNNYLVTSMELGDVNEIHPYRKKPLAHRMVLKMLKYTYGFDIAADQPLFESAEFKGNEVILKFKNAEGLFCKHPYAVKFLLADESHRLKMGDFRIENDTIIVSSKAVEKPILVRYGFDCFYAGSHVYNDAGLPLAPFRTDKGTYYSKQNH